MQLIVLRGLTGIGVARALVLLEKGIPAKKVSINNSRSFGEIIEETDFTFVMLQVSTKFRIRASPGGKGRRGMIDCIIPTSRQYCPIT